MNLWVLSFHKKVPAGVGCVTPQSMELVVSLGVGCVTPQAEPAPDFASWHTVRFLLYHAE